MIISAAFIFNETADVATHGYFAVSIWKIFQIAQKSNNDGVPC